MFSKGHSLCVSLGFQSIKLNILQTPDNSLLCAERRRRRERRRENAPPRPPPLRDHSSPVLFLCCRSLYIYIYIYYKRERECVCVCVDL